MALRKILGIALWKVKADTSELKSDLKQAEAEVAQSAAKMEATASTAAATAAVAQSTTGAFGQTKQVVRSISSVVSVLTRILGILGLITAAVAGLAKLYDTIANSASRAREAQEAVAKETGAMLRQIADDKERRRLHGIADDVERLEETIRSLREQETQRAQEAARKITEESEEYKQLKPQVDRYLEQLRELRRMRDERPRGDPVIQGLQREIDQVLKLYDVAKQRLQFLLDAQVRDELDKVADELLDATRELERAKVRRVIELQWEPLNKLNREIEQLNRNIIQQGVALGRMADVVQMSLSRDRYRR